MGGSDSNGGRLLKAALCLGTLDGRKEKDSVRFIHMLRSPSIRWID